MTIMKEKEYEMIKQGLSFNQDTGKWCAEYPYIVNPRYQKAGILHMQH